MNCSVGMTLSRYVFKYIFSYKTGRAASSLLHPFTMEGDKMPNFQMYETKAD